MSPNSNHAPGADPLYTQLHNPAALLRVDRTFTVVDASPAAAHMLGYRGGQELLGVPLHRFFTAPGAFEAFTAQIRHAIPPPHPDLPSPIEINMIDGLGRPRHLLWLVQIDPGADGAPQEIRANLVDLGAHHAELEALRTSELHLRLLVEHAQDIIFNIDTTTTRITALNPAFEAVTGWNRSEWIGKSFAPLVHPDDLALALRIIRDAIATQAAPNFELRMHSRSGRYITIEFSTALHQQAGEVTHWLGIARDVTARKEAEAATKRYLQRLQTLHKIDRAVLLVQSPQEIAFVALSHLANLVTCDYASIMLLDFAAGEAELVTEFRDEQLMLGERDPFPLSELGLPPGFMQGQPNYQANLPDYQSGSGVDDLPQRFAHASIGAQKLRSVLNLPLLARDVMVGVLTLAGYRPNAFSEETQEVAGQVANQLAVSLQGVRLLEAEQKARHLAETLGMASMALAQTLQIDIMLEKLLDYLRQLVPYQGARVYLLEGDSLRLATTWAEGASSPTAALPGQDLPLADHPRLAQLLAEAKTVVVDDLADSPDGRPHASSARSWLGVPLISQERRLGLYFIEHARVGFFRDEHVRAAEALAAQTAIALANTQLLEERRQYAVLLEERVSERTAALERSKGLIAALSQVATRVQSSMNPDKAIETLGKELQHLLGVSSMVALLDPPSQALEIRYATQDERTARILEKIAVQGSRGPSLTRANWPLYLDLVEQKRTLFLPDAILRAYDRFFDPADLDVEPLLAAAGITQDIKSIFLPLLIEDRVLGVLLLWGESLQEIDIPAVTIFAGQIATALEMARLHAQVQAQRVQEQEALLRLSQALLGEVDVEATNQQALALVQDIFAPDLAAIMLLDEGGEQMVLQAGLGWQTDELGLRIPVGANSLAAHSLRTNRPVVVVDVAREDRFMIHPTILAQGVVSGVATPMAAGNKSIGVLGLFWRSQRPVSADESRLLALIGNTTAQSIARARLYEAEQAARHVADILRTANMTLTQSLELSTVLNTLLAAIGKLIPFDSGNVMLLGEDKRIVLAAVTGYAGGDGEESLAEVSFDPSHATFAPVFQQREGYIISDTQLDPRWEWIEGGLHGRSWLCMPLISRGDVMGIFALDKAEPNFFTPQHLKLAETLAAQAASAIQNAMLFQKVTAGQERLRALSRRLVDVQETERSRVARDLHEGVGQYLTGLSLSLKAGTQGGPDSLHSQLVTTRAIVNELTAQVREMSLALRPTLLDDMGLEPALAWLLERHAKQTGQQMEFDHSNLAGQRFPAAMETALFRIVQEILDDLVDLRARQAGGSPPDLPALWLRVWQGEGALHLKLLGGQRDDRLAQILGGEKISNLYSLQERANLLGGQLFFAEESEQGSYLRATLPLTGEAANP